MGLRDIFRRAESAEEKKKRKLRRAVRKTDKLLAQAGRAKLHVRRMAIKAELSAAKTNLNIARAEEREAVARRKKAERAIWEERTKKVGAVLSFLGSLGGGKSTKRRKAKARR